MELWTELIDPYYLTEFSRELVDQNDAGPDTLADIFPVHDPVPGGTFSFYLNSRNNDIASFRAFDAEARIGSDPQTRRVTVELPPLSIKRRITEYEQVRRQAPGSPETVQAAAQRITAEAVDAVTKRLVKARAEALATGKLAINEDGFVQDVDFGRNPAFTATAGTKWDAATAGDPVDDLVKWVKLITDDPYGEAPDTLLVSSTVMAVLMRSDKIRAYFGTAAAGLIGAEQIGALFASFGLPAPRVFDAKVNGERLVDEKTVILARTGAGSTVYGTTAEAQDGRYNIPLAAQPGLVAGVYREDDPLSAWVRANAVALPILTNANSTFAATVLK